MRPHFIVRFAWPPPASRPRYLRYRLTTALDQRGDHASAPHYTQFPSWRCDEKKRQAKLRQSHPIDLFPFRSIARDARPNILIIRGERGLYLHHPISATAPSRCGMRSRSEPPVARQTFRGSMPLTGGAKVEAHKYYLLRHPAPLSIQCSVKTLFNSIDGARQRLPAQREKQVTKRSHRS